jgi:hypothetical protein
LLPPVRLGLFRKELIKDIVIAARRSSPGDVKLPLLRERRGVFGVLVVLVVLAFLVAQVLLVLLIVVEGTSPDFRTLGLLSRIWDHRHRRHSRAVQSIGAVSSSIGEFRASYEHRRTRRGERAGTSGIARPMPLERSCIECLAAIAFACAVSSAGCTFRTSSDSFSASRYMAIHVSGAPCHRRRQMMILLLTARAWDGQSRARERARARASARRGNAQTRVAYLVCHVDEKGREICRALAHELAIVAPLRLRVGAVEHLEHLLVRLTPAGLRERLLVRGGGTSGALHADL